MTKQKPLPNAAGEVREVNDADLAKGTSIAALPKALQTKLRNAEKRLGPSRSMQKLWMGFVGAPVALAQEANCI